MIFITYLLDDQFKSKQLFKKSCLEIYRETISAMLDLAKILILVWSNERKLQSFTMS